MLQKAVSQTKEDAALSFSGTMEERAQVAAALSYICQEELEYLIGPDRTLLSDKYMCKYHEPNTQFPPDDSDSSRGFIYKKEEFPTVCSKPNELLFVYKCSYVFCLSL